MFYGLSQLSFSGASPHTEEHVFFETGENKSLSKGYDIALGLLKPAFIETKWTKPISRVHGPVASNTLTLMRSLRGKELYLPGMGTTEWGNKGVLGHVL